MSVLRSMTGYAQACAEDGPWNATVTVRAVNHRYLDLRLRLPGDLEPFEPRLKKAVRTRIRRGRLEIQVKIERGDKQPLQVDREFVRSYLALHSELRQEFELAGEADLTAVLRIPGVLRQGDGDLAPEEAGQLAALTERVLAEALGQLDEMRAVEGAALESELRERIERIGAARTQLLELSRGLLPAQTEKLQARIQELLGEAAMDPARLAEEAAYRVERGDISEELTRLESHREQFGQLLDQGAEAGKKLDFLLQEMNREANTILSKTPGLGEAGLEMTRLGLDIKSEIERLREQVQNVE